MSKMEQNEHRATSPSGQLAHKNHQNICAEKEGGLVVRALTMRLKASTSTTKPPLHLRPDLLVNFN